FQDVPVCGRSWPSPPESSPTSIPTGKRSTGSLRPRPMPTTSCTIRWMVSMSRTSRMKSGCSQSPRKAWSNSNRNRPQGRTGYAMDIAIQVIKCYVVETEGGDTTDPASVKAHIAQVEKMPITEIEFEGSLIRMTTEHAEVVGPSDE